jgi:antitoxin component YwqK of YwqJK toxin-antitoxin module
MVLSCIKKVNTKFDLVNKNGLLCRPGSSVPFTGREKARLADRIIEYDVVEGIKNGNFKISYSDGKPQIVGQIVNNRNEGLWKYYYDNFQLESKGNFKNDIAEGEWIFYYSDGKVKEQGNFISGKRDGDWKSYDENGKISIKKEFKNSELITK